MCKGLEVYAAMIWVNYGVAGELEEKLDSASGGCSKSGGISHGFVLQGELITHELFGFTIGFFL